MKFVLYYRANLPQLEGWQSCDSHGDWLAGLAAKSGSTEEETSFQPMKTTIRLGRNLRLNPRAFARDIELILFNAAPAGEYGADLDTGLVRTLVEKYQEFYPTDDVDNQPKGLAGAAPSPLELAQSLTMYIGATVTFDPEGVETPALTPEDLVPRLGAMPSIWDTLTGTEDAHTV